GFQLHVHSIGDAATGNVLDALEEARKVTGDGDFRNTITHLQLVSEGDYARFRRLGVIANVQPYWAFKMPFTWENIDLPKLGERAERQHPIG
ncbi:MAG TPA: amidohydrolase family protein, partial [Candidatus Wallbacteria bacterium]|nr:amidohydrolase family protein [Candidatus Wallbacteria bacterium]